jgi:hypothetical protein
MMNRAGTAVSALIKTSDLQEPRFKALSNYIQNERGIHSVSCKATDSSLNYHRLLITGTERALHTAQAIIGISGFEQPANSDHDHDDCIKRAQSMGVPAAWAHTPETYLSM